jgi:hypothetical protein
MVTTAVDYWTTVSKFMPDWWKVKKREIRPIELRQENISTHSVVLRALGGVGAEMMKRYPSEWKDRLADLTAINWSKKNRDWENVCMVANSVVANRQARLATKAYVKRKLGLPVSESEQKSIVHLTAKEEVKQPHNSGETGNQPIQEGPLTKTDWDTLLMNALKTLKGKAHKPDVEAEVFKKMDPASKQHYQHSVGEGIPAWKKNIQWARQRACNDGLIEPPETVGSGTWQLTRKGWDFGAR